MTTLTQTQTATIRTLIRAFDFAKLFNELGWDHYGQSLPVEAGGVRYELRAVAEKRGMVVYVCEQSVGAAFPDRETRLKIERQVARTTRLHIIIYKDAERTQQVWQWVRREQGKPSAPREHKFSRGGSGENIAQRLAQVFIGFDEEESLTGTGMQTRAAKAFDVDRVTKKFYDRFKIEHSAFLQRIAGIEDDEARAWYASLMLNRLMFTYFIQKKGFLAGDVNYLPNKLRAVRARYGDGQFHSFYRSFLLRLFHEGLGQPKAARDRETAALIGEIPYLNGGLFELHQIERDYDAISIPDEAFERIFSFFESYEWHLDTEHHDERHSDNEINPDVLGYIFEKYINQKQMGAYYTKEDITEYIGKNTILPFALEQARANCKVAFDGPASEVWRLLAEDPDRYIYDAVRCGVDLALPAEIAAGVGDVARRGGWNRPASAGFALPTETWREHVARRTRCLELRAKLAAGDVTAVNDLITYNLDIRRFTQDVIENCEGPELLRALWRALSGVTILDPTCGSGAFLFAALNILEPLYAACLDRMAAFVAQADATPNASKALYADFRATLAQVELHSNRRYFILKSIIINNLYGVDIMEEATEIAKLRLFLKLVAQVDDARRLEPLPDIDFNIRAGNTLVGFATLADARKAVAGHLFWSQQMPQIEQAAADIDRLFGHFHQQQMEIGGEVTKADKRELQARLTDLGATLDQFLAAEYGIDEYNIPDPAAYAARLAEWKRSHRPFHWFLEFYGIVQARGGFDVIIGNPPYVEYSSVKSSYTVRDLKTEASGNLFAYMLERSIGIMPEAGRVSMIVPIALLAGERTAVIREVVLDDLAINSLSSFGFRPSHLFDGVNHRLSILVARKGHRDARRGVAITSTYNLWAAEERGVLFDKLAFVHEGYTKAVIGKFGTEMELAIADCLSGCDRVAGSLIIPPQGGRSTVFFNDAVLYWARATDSAPTFRNVTLNRAMNSSTLKALPVPDSSAQAILLALVNSSLFFWYWLKYSDCRHLTLNDIKLFPFPSTLLESESLRQIGEIVATLMGSYQVNSVTHRRNQVRTGLIEYQRFFPSQSKPIIDEIDRVLARHYGFTDEELDFIINYDIKYRMGQSGDDESEGGDE